MPSPGDEDRACGRTDAAWLIAIGVIGLTLRVVPAREIDIVGNAAKINEE